MSEAKQISRDELVALMGGLKGATILSLTFSSSDPARYKRDKGRITKVTRMSGMINARYDRKKARSMGIEVSEVEVSPQPWKEHLSGPVCQHRTKGTKYIEFYPQSGTTNYTLDGTPCKKEDIADLVKKPSKSVVNYRLIKVENVKAAVINKTNYVVV